MLNSENMSNSNKIAIVGLFILLFFICIGSSFAMDNSSCETVNLVSEESIIEEAQLDEIDSSDNIDSLNSENSLDFTSNVTEGTGSLNVQFNGTSNEDNIETWYWDFGDGENSSEQNPSHYYSNFGSYNVSLTTKNADGIILGNIIKPYYINVYKDSGNIFNNPNFEDGLKNWIIEYNSYTDGYKMSVGSLKWNTASKVNCLKVNGHLVVEGDRFSANQEIWFGQYIDFTVIDNISFEALRNPAPSNGEGPTIITVAIGNYTTKCTLSSAKVIEKYTIDTKNITGLQLCRIFIYTHGNTIYSYYPDTYFNRFSGSYNGLNVANFDYIINSIENDNLTISFINAAKGSTITNVLWDFGDGTTSTEINPTKTIKVGSNVTLTVFNSNKTSNSYSIMVGSDLPKIGDKFYISLQDAIDDAEEGAIIDLNSNLVGDLQVNKSLTINFNGNTIIGSGSPVIQVLDGAKVTIKNITFEDSNVISTDDESMLTITESNITNSDIILNNGNIAIDSNEFNNSFITITNANAVISNNNVANGGIKVNGGKSKINNNVLSGNDVAITQTEGETNITSNIITDNNIGVNVTNGIANINFNVIYNNNNVSIAYVGNVDATNNWFGVIQPTFTTISSDKYVDVYAPEAESQPAWLVLILNTNETTLSSAQNYTINVDLTHNSKGDDTSALGVLPKFSLPVSTELGKTSAINAENSIGEFTLTTTTLTTDEAIFTINNEDYTLDVTIFKIEDRIKELETQLAEAQANNTKLAEDLANANQKADNLTNQLSEAQANNTKLVGDLSDANQKAENLTTQLGDAQKQIQSLSADLISTTVAAKDLSIKALDSGNVQVTLKANGAALANKSVDVIINGVTYKGTTDDNGVAKIAVKFASAGTYYATVSFAGDDTYKSSISTSKVVVSKKSTKITAPKKSFKAKVKTKKVKITLKSGSTVLKSKKITLKVNGKTYTAKTNSKGVATIKVTKLTKKGTFTYTVKFAGDKAYKAITKKGKITIK